MKNLVEIVLILCALIGGGCDREKAKRQQVAEAESEWRGAISAFAKAHGAVIDWESRLTKRFDEATFSIDISRALIHSNRQPVLLVMDLKDVAASINVQTDEDALEELLAKARGNTVPVRMYTAYFSEYYVSNHSFRLALELKCTQEQADRLLGTTDARLRYAIVARILEVSCRRIEFDSPPDEFLAKGMCVDLLREEKTRERR